MPEDETQDFQITSNIYSNYNTSLDNIETKSNSNMVNKIEIVNMFVNLYKYS